MSPHCHVADGHVRITDTAAVHLDNEGDEYHTAINTGTSSYTSHKYGLNPLNRQFYFSVEEQIDVK